MVGEGGEGDDGEWMEKMEKMTIDGWMEIVGWRRRR